MYFCVKRFEIGVNDSRFSGNEQQKVWNENEDILWLMPGDFTQANTKRFYSYGREVVKGKT